MNVISYLLDSQKIIVLKQTLCSFLILIKKNKIQYDNTFEPILRKVINTLVLPEQP